MSEQLLSFKQDASAQSFQIVKGFKTAGIDFCASVPCRYVSELLAQIAHDPQILHTPVTREEEGIGICAGAHLAGRRPVLVMQNSGLGNCINALCSLTKYYAIPLTLMISHRGQLGERIGAQTPMGLATTRILEALDIPYFELESDMDLVRVPEFVEYAHVLSAPVAILTKPIFWRDR